MEKKPSDYIKTFLIYLNLIFIILIFIIATVAPLIEFIVFEKWISFAIYILLLAFLILFIKIFIIDFCCDNKKQK